jgi:hypothetical protein
VTRARIVRTVAAHAVGLAAWTAAVAGAPAIEALSARWDGTRVRVSYRVLDALTEDGLERIHSGIPVRFRHRIELRMGRGLLLPARELGRTVVDTHVTYDSLTQQYHLRRESRLHRGSEAQPMVDETVTDSREVMEDWMSRLADVPLEPADRRSWDVARVRVDVTLDRRWVLLVFPSTVDASAAMDVEKPR